MRRWLSSQVIGVILVSAAMLACGRSKPGPDIAQPSSQPGPRGMVLGIDEGERRVRRNVGKGPFILKVDRQNGASPDLVMGYEDIAPGGEIQPHTHLVADEILFIHRGSGVARLGERESSVRAGSTVYIPRNVQISVRNTGTEPLGVAFVFSKPGFEELMRDNSVPEGQPVTPISAEERDSIRKRHSWHTIYPPATSAPKPSPAASPAKP